MGVFSLNAPFQFFPHQQIRFYKKKKKKRVHEQVSDMQTSTLSRNKYTRRQREKVSGGLTAFW